MKQPYRLYLRALLLLLLLVVGRAAQAQDLTNTGTVLTLTGGAMLFTTGSLTNAGGTLDLSAGPNALLVGGNLVNATGATLSAGTASTVTLIGASTQQLDLHGASLANLTITNTGGGVQLPASSNADVSGTLTLTSGLVTTAPTTTLRLLDGATITGEQNGRYVRGNLAAVKASVPASALTTFANSFTLAPTTMLANLTVTRTAGLQTAQLSYGTNASGSTKGIDRLWRTSAPVTGSVQLTWLSDNDNGLSDFAHSQPWARTAAPTTGTSWTLAGATQDASTLRTVQATVLAGSSFSFFTVSTVEAPLPVTLVSFTAQRQGADGLLSWTTAAELNNAYFQLESSVDGTTFQRLGQVAGAGTSSQAHSYQFTDVALARYGTKLVYYRLRQVDTGGAAAYSPVRTIATALADSWLVQAYPNPSAPTTALVVLVQTEYSGEVQLTLTDAVGRLVSQQRAQLAPGTTSLRLAAAPTLSTGVYALQVRQGAQQQTLKLVRQ